MTSESRFNIKILFLLIKNITNYNVNYIKSKKMSWNIFCRLDRKKKIWFLKKCLNNSNQFKYQLKKQLHASSFCVRYCWIRDTEQLTLISFGIPIRTEYLQIKQRIIYQVMKTIF